MKKYSILQKAVFLPVSLVLMALLSIMGCVHRAAPTKSLKKNVAALSIALKEQDAGKLFALLSPVQKVGMKKEDIVKAMDNNRREVANLAAKIGTAKNIRIEAEVFSPAGRILTLVHEDGKWKIKEGLLPLSANLTTPADACEQLRKSLQLLRSAIEKTTVFDESYRTSLVSSIDRIIDELTTINHRVIVITDDRAAVILPSARRIELVFRDGRWKIVGIMPLP